MRILLVNHYAGSREHGMEHRPYYLAREWQRLGHEVKVAVASFSHLRLKSPMVSSSLTEENVDGVPYLWLKTPRYKGNGPGRAINMFAFVGQLFRYSKRLTEGARPDVVIASSTYPLDNIPARSVARRCGAKLVYEVHDLWPLSPVELGGMSARHPFILLMQWAENSAYRSADHVISLLPNARPHMEAHGMAPGKFACVPNGIAVADWQNTKDVLPQTHDAALSKLRESGQFILGYTGGHAISNALSVLLDAARLLSGEHVALVLVGAGAEKERLKEKVRSLALGNVTFLPPVSKSVVPALLRAMDGVYLGWQNKPIYRFGVSPNKLFEYMMAAKPVIHSTNASNDPVAESDCGFTVPPEDPTAIVAAIRHLIQMPKADREAMGRRGRDYVVKHHDYSVLAKKFLDVLR